MTYTKPVKWLSLNREQRREWYSYARSSMNHCEEDLETEAIRAGFMSGVRFAMEMIAERIRAELVCCPSEHIDAMQELMADRNGKPMSSLHEFHAICYWSEMSARLAEDPHSLLASPYNCKVDHPGECWSAGRVGSDGDES